MPCGAPEPRYGGTRAGPSMASLSRRGLDAIGIGARGDHHAADVDVNGNFAGDGMKEGQSFRGRDGREDALDK